MAVLRDTVGRSTTTPIAKALLRRLLKVSNWFLVAIHVVAGCILMSLGFSGQEYAELSMTSTGIAEPPFASSFINIVLTPWFGILATVLTLTTVVKEFFIKTLKQRVKLNVMILIFLLLLLGLILPALYRPA